jgi:2-hydroxychromene-2-carboxylate isomerase
VQRRAGLVDILLLAAHYGIPLEGPPKHPFNSVPAARVTLAVAAAQRRMVMDRFFRAAWAEGQDLENFEVLHRLLRECQVDLDPEACASDRGLRQALKARTRSFIEAGGFGVPTLRVRDRLFFGHDRMELAEAYALGRIELDDRRLQAMLARPQPPRLK